MADQTRMRCGKIVLTQGVPSNLAEKGLQRSAYSNYANYASLDILWHVITYPSPIA